MGDGMPNTTPTEAPGPSTPEEPDLDPDLESRCKDVIREYREGATHTAYDDIVLARVKIRCGQLYPKSPCPKVLIKLGVTPNIRYRVICGSKNKSEEV
jgi:hypothetical protein